MLRARGHKRLKAMVTIGTVEVVKNHRVPIPGGVKLAQDSESEKLILENQARVGITALCRLGFGPGGNKG